MPDVVAYSSSDSDKYKNNPSHDTLRLLNDSKNKNGDSSFFSVSKLSFFGNNTMNCDKISLKELQNLDSEEVLRNNSMDSVSKYNSSITESDSTPSDLIYVNELENGINSDFDNENKNLCKNIVNNWDSNLTNKEYISNLLQKPNNVTCTLTNGSPNLKDIENIESNASFNSLVKDAIEENENIKYHRQKQLNNSEFTNEPINSKVIIHTTKIVSSNESSLDTIQAAVNNSNPINLHDKNVDLVSCRNKLAVNSNEIQSTSESSSDSDDSSQSDNGNKIEHNEKSEAVSPASSNSICQKEDFVESSVKEACGDGTSLSKNAEQIGDFQIKTDDTLCNNSSDNFTSSHSSMENYAKTSEKKSLDTTLDSSCGKETKDRRNLKRKKGTSPDDDNSYNYKHGKTKRLKMVQESTNDTSCKLNEDANSKEKGIQSVPTCSKSSNFAPVKQEKCLNPNELYQGLLNDVLAEDKELIKGPEVVRTKLQRIKRKDLEDMIIDQVMNKVLHDHEFGYQRELCKRLEQTLEAANKRALRLTQEMESLRNTTKKVAAEHKRRKTRLVHPTKVKRSVGIQANKSYISQGISSAFLPNSDATIIIPTKYQRSKKNGNSEVSKTKTKIKSEPGDTSINKTEEDYLGIGKTIEQKLSTLRKDLMNSEIKSSSTSKDKNGKLSRKHGAVNGKELTSSDLPKTEIEEESESLSEPKHPAPLPHIPFDEEELLTWKVPPSPVLKVQLRNKSIILSWTITANYDESLILSYQLFSYEESKEDPPSTDLWQKIGSVKALELPMACTLTQFKCGRVYHFAVRAMTKKGRLGPFSIPISLQMPPK